MAKIIELVKQTQADSVQGEPLWGSIKSKT
jgi:hypothetical protein